MRRQLRHLSAKLLLVPFLTLTILAGSSFTGSSFSSVGLDVKVASADTGVNFSGYCKAQYGGPAMSVTATHAWAGSWTLVTWRCNTTGLFKQIVGQPASFGPPLPFGRCLGCRVVTSSRSYEIDVNAVCRWQNGQGSSAYYVGQSWGDWRCRT